MQPSANRLLQAIKNLSRQLKPVWLKKLYCDPVFIVSAPRSGSTLLFEILSQSPDFWTIGEESHSIFNALPELRPARSGYHSGRLTAAQADGHIKQMIRCGFLFLLRDRNGRRYLNQSPDDRPDRVRFLEKTPRNALNIPFLLKIFPDAKFVFLHRDAKQNISSLIEAWNVGLKDGSFVTFPNLPGWSMRHWCMLLPPHWETMNGKSIAEIAAFQWRSCNEIMLEDLQRIQQRQWTSISYEGLIENPDREIQRLCEFCGVNFDSRLSDTTARPLPLSKTTISNPNPDKWRRHETEIMPLLAALQPISDRLASLPAGSSPLTRQ